MYFIHFITGSQAHFIQNLRFVCFRVRHILNVTREIDNFFPGMFDYLNVRVYDDEKTDLLKHWDNTFKYINKARNEGSKVLVHCKMGISRSASVVIAYAMKAFNWNFDKALKHVKAKRNCIKPNTNFLNQLETYQGILDAMKNKEKLQRSKSETNLKSPKSASKTESKVMDPTPLVLALTGSCRGRPRSWSPDTKLASELLPPTSVSFENLSSVTRHMLMEWNGSYSVSPNQIIRLKEEGAPSVKHIVNEIENASSSERRDFRRYQRLNFSNPNETPSSKSSDTSGGSVIDISNRLPQVSPSKTLSQKYAHSEADKIHTWDPGEGGEGSWVRGEDNRNTNESDNIVKSDSGIIDMKTKTSDVFSNSLERNLDSDSRRGVDDDAPPPSRQSSWSSSDSAVVPDLSRHSSWGSYDTRTARSQAQPATARDDAAKRSKDKVEERVAKKEDERSAPEAACAPQRPTSDLGIISEHTEVRGGGRVARSSTDISDNERKFNETCAILKELASAAARMERSRSRGASTWSGRLSASAPADTWLRAGLRRRRPACASHGDLPRAAPPAPPAHPRLPRALGLEPPTAAAAAAAGLVSNLKKEFEALSENDTLRRSKSRGRTPASEGRERALTSPSSGEDLSVRVLVGRYDQPGRSRCESACEASRPRATHESGSKKCKLGEGEAVRARSGAAAALRNSFCGAVRGAGGGERPPPAPTVLSIAPIDYSNVVVSTVMSKAQNKKQLQHGKTHPLTRLNMNRSNNRCSNPVYNTM